MEEGKGSIEGKKGFIEGKEKQAEQIAEVIKEKKCYLIGICGIPGAGKSTFAHQLKTFLPNSVVVPLDGFHLYRKDLDS